MKKYKTMRVKVSTHKNLQQKQDNLKKYLGKRIPKTVIIDRMAKEPLFLSDVELRKLKKWKKI